MYDIIVGLTNGGPGTATSSVAMTIFTGFTSGDYAYQMANAVIFFLITLVVSRASSSVSSGAAEGVSDGDPGNYRTRRRARATGVHRRRRMPDGRPQGQLGADRIILAIVSLIVLVPLYFTIAMALKSPRAGRHGHRLRLPLADAASATSRRRGT